MSRKKSNNEGRDESGRFAEGNRLARGNPFNRRMAEMRQAMLNAVSPEDLQDVIRQVVVKARLGDLAAAKLVLSYVVGKPSTPVEPDRVDLDEWKLHTERPATSQVEGLMVGGCRPDLANLTIRAMDVNVGDALGRCLEQNPPGSVRCADGLSAAAKPAPEATPKGGKPAKAPVKPQQPVESTDVSVLGGNGHVTAPLSHIGQVIERIVAERLGGSNGNGATH